MKRTPRRHTQCYLLTENDPLCRCASPLIDASVRFRKVAAVEFFNLLIGLGSDKTRPLYAIPLASLLEAEPCPAVSGLASGGSGVCVAGGASGAAVGGATCIGSPQLDCCQCQCGGPSANACRAECPEQERGVRTVMRARCDSCFAGGAGGRNGAGEIGSGQWVLEVNPTSSTNSGGGHFTKSPNCASRSSTYLQKRFRSVFRPQRNGQKRREGSASPSRERLSLSCASAAAAGVVMADEPSSTDSASACSYVYSFSAAESTLTSPSPVVQRAACACCSFSDSTYCPSDLAALVASTPDANGPSFGTCGDSFGNAGAACGTRLCDKDFLKKFRLDKAKGTAPECCIHTRTCEWDADASADGSDRILWPVERVYSPNISML